MEDIPDFDLMNLDDSVFNVQTVIFQDENELFNIVKFLDDFVKSNETAKLDGVFRGRLVESLQDSGSDVQHFWSMIDNSPKRYLTTQFLKSPDQQKSFLMEHQTVKVHESSAEFMKTLRKPDTLNNPDLNCCTRALQEGGEKAAVKHFYDTLQSKALHAEKWQNSSIDSTQKKDLYKARQKLLQGLDPATKCARIEASMSSKTYNVTDMPAITDDTCQCHRCHLDMQSGRIAPKPGKFDAYGNSDTCSLYFTDIEESCKHFLYITKNFALSHLCHLNMLTDLSSYYAGVSYPYVYVGGHHSFFPMHVEDMSLWSINFLHKGDPKLFIVVAPHHALKLSRVLSCYGLSNFHRICIYKLGHKSSIVFPQLLLHHGISFKIIIQKPGDFVFLAPNAAHTGGNMGVNMAEACNIGTEYWLPYGSVAQSHNCSCIEKGVHMDITPLIMMHRPDLLEAHLNKCMHVAFPDEHFKKSIIVPHLASEQQAGIVADLVPSTVEKASSSTIRKRSRSPLVCPIDGCFTEYMVPKKKTLLQHIKMRHPNKAGSKKTLEKVNALFPKKGSLRKTCEDCGSDISVFSNKHRGSAKCIMAQSKSLLKQKEHSGNDDDDTDDVDDDDDDDDY